MRTLLVLAAVTMATPALAADKAPATGSPKANCPQTTSYLAEQSSLYRGPGVAPKKLNQLPAATGYMAVYRKIGGCEVPLTFSDYRRFGGR